MLVDLCVFEDCCLFVQDFLSQLTVNLFNLAFVYLAEVIIIKPSPRNHISHFLNLAAALSGNSHSAKSKFATTSTSLIHFQYRL